MRARFIWSRSRSAHVAGATVLSLVLALAPFALPTAAAPASSAVSAVSGDDSAGKVQPRLLKALEKPGSDSFVIDFKQTPDLTAASRIDDWARRGETVAEVLKDRAQASQASVVAELEASGADYQSFWIDNTIHVQTGNRRMALAAADDDEVAEIRAADTVPLEEPVEAKAEPRVSGGVEWGIADIRADQVWHDYADLGEGIVVANIDSGAQFDHPALVASYRGNTGNGTFSHDYNWWDPSGVCAPVSLEPCDDVGHGSHTMGTMVGDDGEGNKIGVAPGARWMAAVGCQFNGCSEFALTSSAQWILEPTDLRGQNPDASRRPHIVNNSWSGTGHHDWYQDFVRAWIASGIFPVFSNGNTGPDCDTTGSPAAFRDSYSVGNYRSDGTIADTSSRGPGFSHENKPNISAPGTAVRSSVPRDRYEVYSGTSMAAPHLAGTVALLWSAAPSLIGDVEATRNLLDDTARDEADFQCGGSADDNNVYGEGRLDAAAVVAAAPRGEVGTLQGTITDASSGEPVAGVRIELSGVSTRTVATGPDGRYSIKLTQGTYAATATKYGFKRARLDGIEIARDQSTTSDLALSPSKTVTLSGSVRDGAGHGWPVHAHVVLPGTPAGTYSDPVSGRYSLRVPSDETYEVRIESEYPGYRTEIDNVSVHGDTTRNWRLDVDEDSCTAPGYQRGRGLRQRFDRPRSVRGWTVADGLGDGQRWRFDDPGQRGNRTGGTGGFAVLDSDAYGQDGRQDTSLVSPVVDLTGVSHPVVEFATDFKFYFFERADLDVSIDGGATWENAWRAESPVRGPGRVRVELPGAADQPDTRVRFHYVSGDGQAWWWQVDDVFVGDQTCEKSTGGLLVGHVSSPLTGEPVNGARISADGRPAEQATSGVSVDDGVADGFYSMFSSANGKHRFTASADGHTAATVRTSVHRDRVNHADFDLGTGRLTQIGPSIAGTVRLGHKVTRRLRLVNTGDGEARYVLEEREPRDESATSSGATHVDQDAWAEAAPYPTPVKDTAAGYLDGLLYSFGGTVGGPSSDDGAAGAPLKESYVYDPSTSRWRRIADLPEAREKPSGAFINGKFVVTGGWGENDSAPVGATSIYDPDTDTWSAGATNPSPWAASGTAVLNGSLYVIGGCAPHECGNTDVLRYDPEERTWSRLADYPQNTAWASCGGIHGKIYCAGGIGDHTDSLATYAYTPATDRWTRVADMPEDLWASAYSVSSGRLIVAGGSNNHAENISDEAFAYDPMRDLWRQLPDTNYALYRSSGACGFFKVGGSEGYNLGNPAVERLPGLTDCSPPLDSPWLVTRSGGGHLKAGRITRIRVTLDARRVTEPGTYTASLHVDDDTPFHMAPVPVTMVVTARKKHH